jgi:glutamate carboxypeptidase
MNPSCYSRGTMNKLWIVCVVLAAASAAVFAQDPMTPVEVTMVRSVDAQMPSALALLEKLVDINSGTMNLAGVVEVKDTIAPMLQSLGFKVHWVPMDEAQRAGDLVAEHPCPLGEGLCGKRLLLIGHMDTVFEKESTFQTYALVPGNDNNVATGPGVNDMKGGLVVMLMALRAMQSAGVLDTAEIRLVLSGDEERHGEPLTLVRRDLLDAAHASDLALEFEPGMRVNGVDTIGITRRSSISWHLDTTGKSGHSSQIFNDTMGYGAIYEITRILDAFRTQLREPGLTYNVGLLLGGATASLNETRVGGTATGKSNVIPSTAIALGDIRTLDNAQTDRTEQKMRSIVEKHLPRTGATISFDEGYPPMSATEAGHELARQMNEVNATLGLPPMPETDPMLRGAGDISFVAPIIPGLVGVGPMGEGMHAEGEIVLLDSIPRQAKRDALLMYRLSQQK